MLKLSNGTDGSCNCLRAHWTHAATSAALQRRGSEKYYFIFIIIREKFNPSFDNYSRLLETGESKLMTKLKNFQCVTRKLIFIEIEREKFD